MNFIEESYYRIGDDMIKVKIKGLSEEEEKKVRELLIKNVNGAIVNTILSKYDLTSVPDFSVNYDFDIDNDLKKYKGGGDVAG